MTVAVLFPTVSFHYESKTFVGAEERAECAEVVEQGKCIYIYIYLCAWMDWMFFGGAIRILHYFAYIQGQDLGIFTKRRNIMQGGFM